MKKNLLLLASFLFTIVSLKAQIPNADFELWQNEYPIGYYTSKSILDTLFTPSNVTQSSDAYSGTSAIELTTIEFPNLYDGNTDTLAGTAYSGDLTKKTKGFPIAFKPSTFSGYYKTSFDTVDAASIIIGLYKWNSSTMKRDSIGGAVLYSDTTVGSYTHFSLKINYLNSETPDTAVIYLASSGAHPIPNSTLFVDDLMFDEVVTANLPATAQVSMVAFPNPASETVYFKNIPLAASNVEIVDLTGRLIDQISVSGDTQLNLSAYFPGLYYYNVKSTQGSLLSSGKFSVVK